MSLILLEALGAGLLLVLIVWWTMFSGRDQGEPPRDALDDSSSNARGDSLSDSPSDPSAATDPEAGNAGTPRRADGTTSADPKA